MSKKMCIYCLRNEDTVSFNREHIIPQNIKGNLFLDDCVCVECNSWLGANVDSEILKLPKILEALDKFKINYDKDATIRQFYNIEGRSTDGKLRLRGQMRNGKVCFPPQKLDDGSIISTNDDVDSILKKSSTRDRRLLEAGLEEPYIVTELNKFKDVYNDAKPGEKIEWPSIGRAIKRRETEKLEIEINPRSEAQITKLIAKIIFEFIFFVGGMRFFKEFNFGIGGGLIKTIIGDKPSHKPMIYRAKPEISDLLPVHLIRFETSPVASRFRVAFFANIEFHCILPPSMEVLFKDIEKKMSLEQIMGLHFQQHIDEPIKVLWALMSDGSRERLW